jgi:hypothetical protein
MSRASRIAAVAVVALVLATPAGGIPAPSQFVQRVDNPWFPLTPGSVYVYRGAMDGKSARSVVKVTYRTKTILGVVCVGVENRLYLGGRPAERTTGWYAQDRKGNVWFFGETTAELDGQGSVISTAGSWEAGVNRAVAGVFMRASPKVGQTERPVYLRGEVQDRSRVVSLHGKADTPYVAARDALVTEEWTPLEPDLLELKVYVRGIGLVAAGSADDDETRIELVSFTPGRR